jgi:hypothetical protein
MTVLYGGAAPAIVAGVTQFNVQIDPLPSDQGLTQLSFTIVGQPFALLGSNAFTVSQSVWVKP